MSTNKNRGKLSTGSTRVNFQDLGRKLENPSNMAKALLNLRVSEERVKGQGTEQDQIDRIDSRKLSYLGQVIADNINANTDLRKITPYIRKAEVIWKTLLLSPNGRRKELLEYNSANSMIKNAKLHEALIKIIREYYTNDYKIERELPEMVKELLVGSGAYVKLNITRPALDNLINGSNLVSGNESYHDFALRIKSGLLSEFKETNGQLFAKNLGFVSNTKEDEIQGIETLFSDTPVKSKTEENYEFNILDDKFKITLTDNVSCLSIKNINKMLLDKQELVTGNESLNRFYHRRKDKKSEKEETKQSATTTKKMSLAQEEAMKLIQERQGTRSFETKRAESIRKPNAYSQRPWGTPLRYVPPTEAFIPLYSNSDREHPIAGYFLLDENGEFVRMTKDYQFYKSGTVKKSQGGGGTTNQIISQLAKIQNGEDCDFDMHEFSYLVKNQLERELTQAIASGVSGSQISVELEEEVLKIFLSRAFQQKRTRVLFVPECYFTYMTFQKNNLGIGESLTTEAKEFIARLAALDVADAIAQLDNAQTVNELMIAIAAHDTTPEQSIAMARAAWFKNNPTIHNLVTSNVISTPMLVDALREQSLIVRVDAGDNKFVTAPQISMNQVERTGFRRIDNESRQHLLNSIANFLQLPRSWLDEQDDNSNNFQIEALAEQEMLQNQTILYQTRLGEMVADIIRKDIMVNEVVLTRLVDAIDEAEKKLLTPDSKEKIEGDEDTVKLTILQDFIQNILVTLPPPTTIEKVNKLKEKMDAANDWADKVVEMSVAKGMLEPLMNHLGVDSSVLDPNELYSQFKSLMLYRAYKLFNVPTPFDDVVNKGKEGGVMSLLNDLDYYNENLGGFLVEYLKSTKSRIEKIQKKMPTQPDGMEISDEENPLDSGLPQEEEEENLDAEEEGLETEVEEEEAVEKTEEESSEEETEEPDETEVESDEAEEDDDLENLE